jgi:hypothetical protein
VRLYISSDLAISESKKSDENLSKKSSIDARIDELNMALPNQSSCSGYAICEMVESGKREQPTSRRNLKQKSNRVG